eukprot:838370-Amphidinium_carterae.2
MLKDLQTFKEESSKLTRLPSFLCSEGRHKQAKDDSEEADGKQCDKGCVEHGQPGRRGVLLDQDWWEVCSQESHSREHPSGQVGWQEKLLHRSGSFFQSSLEERQRQMAASAEEATMVREVPKPKEPPSHPPP